MGHLTHVSGMGVHGFIDTGWAWAEISLRSQGSVANTKLCCSTLIDRLSLRPVSSKAIEYKVQLNCGISHPTGVYIDTKHYVR